MNITSNVSGKTLCFSSQRHTAHVHCNQNAAAGFRVSSLVPATRYQRLENIIPSAKQAKAAAPIKVAPTSAEASPAVPSLVNAAVATAVSYHLFISLAMILLPRNKNVMLFVQNLAMFVPLGVMYAVLLTMSWTPDTLSKMMPGSWEAAFSHGFNPQFFPRIDGISLLFSRALTAASAVVHLAAINLFLTRSIYLDGMRTGVPVLHSQLLGVVFGPLGLLSHTITKALHGIFGNRTVSARSGSGSITILPYTTEGGQQML